jgi:hypothetical protein
MLTALPRPPHLQDRPASKPGSSTYHEAGRLSRTRIDEKRQEVPEREAERLAEKIVSVRGRAAVCIGFLGCRGQSSHSCSARALCCLSPPPFALLAFWSVSEAATAAAARSACICEAQVGADYMDAKSRERYGDEWQADDNAAPTMDADSMANKLMKARAVVRQGG